MKRRVTPEGKDFMYFFPRTDPKYYREETKIASAKLEVVFNVMYMKTKT